MTSHPDLFSSVQKQSERLPYGGDAPSQSHSPTSIEAAEKIKKKIGPLHNTILSWLDIFSDGQTDEELCTRMGLDGNTLRPRRRELQLLEKIKDSGTTRPTKSGRSAVVWVKARHERESI